MGAPTGWTLNVTDIQLFAGAGFLVAVAGNMMLMPGLPKAPARTFRRRRRAMATSPGCNFGGCRKPRGGPSKADS